MFGHSAAVLFALVTITAAGGKDVASVAGDQWVVGQKFEIRCADQVLRGELVDRAALRCQIVLSDDGEHFSPPRTVYLLGATAGPQDRQTLILMREVKVGLKLELGLDDLEPQHRMLTGDVVGIRLIE